RLFMLGVAAALKPPMEYVEHHHVPERVLAAITSEDGKEGIRPVVNYQLGFRPSFGVLYFYNRIPNDGRLSFSTAFGGWETMLDDAHATLPLARNRLTLDLDVNYRRRSDELYTGIGLPTHARFARYGIDQIDGATTLAARPLPPLTIAVGVDVGL